MLKILLPLRSCCFVAFLLCLVAFAVPVDCWADDEGLPRREWEAAKKAHKGVGPALWVRIPSNNFKIFSSNIVVTGCTEPDSQVMVNGKELLVFSSGAYAGMVSLGYGKNTLLVSAWRNGVVTNKFIVVERTKPTDYKHRLTLPSLPLKILDTRLAEPSKPHELLAGEKLRLRFIGSPGQNAYFRIGTDKLRYPMPELKPGTNGALYPGYYEAYYTVLPKDDYMQARLTLMLEEKKPAKGKKAKVISLRLEATLTTNVKDIHRYVETVRDRTALFTSEKKGKRLTLVQKGTRLEIIGRRGDLLHVWIDPTRTAWVERDNVQAPSSNIEPTALAVRPQLDAVSVTHDTTAKVSKIAFAMNYTQTENNTTSSTTTTTSPSVDWRFPLPFRVEANQEERKLKVTIWGASGQGFKATSSDKVTSTSLQAALVEQLRSEPLVEDVQCVRTSSETLEVDISLSNKRVWNYNAGFQNGVLTLNIKQPPRAADDKDLPLKGLQIIVDAGHGGKDPGATGAAGLLESDSTLAISRRLASLLQQKGAKVTMLREKDEYVSLETRAIAVEKSNADLCLSIHNNSLDETTNPLDFRGPLVFYTHPQQKELAWALYQALPKIPEKKPRDIYVRQRELRITDRAPQMPATLVECLYLSNPEDEMLLLDPAFLDTLSLSLYKGILAYLRPGHQSVEDPKAGVELAPKILKNKLKEPRKFFLAD